MKLHVHFHDRARRRDAAELVRIAKRNGVKIQDQVRRQGRDAKREDFLNPLRFKGKVWYLTGKYGKRTRNSAEVAEYKNSDDGDRRVWAEVGGKAPEED